MNERILELADKAVEDMPSGPWNIPDEFCKKFAELIVGECIGKCEFVANIAEITNTGEMARKTKATSDSCATMIKEHFGVEE
jgi:hypothetical protein